MHNAGLFGLVAHRSAHSGAPGVAVDNWQAMEKVRLRRQAVAERLAEGGQSRIAEKGRFDEIVVSAMARAKAPSVALSGGPSGASRGVGFMDTTGHPSEDDAEAGTTGAVGVARLAGPGRTRSSIEPAASPNAAASAGLHMTAQLVVPPLLETSSSILPAAKMATPKLPARG